MVEVLVLIDPRVVIMSLGNSELLQHKIPFKETYRMLETVRFLRSTQNKLRTSACSASAAFYSGHMIKYGVNDNLRHVILE